MTLQEVTPIVAYLFAIAVSAERGTEIVKNALKLGDKIKDDKLKVAVYHLISAAFSIGLVYVAEPPTKLLPVYLIGFLASAGSGVWNTILTMLMDAKKNIANPPAPVASVPPAASTTIINNK
jgi:hypothetical protein